MFLHTLFYKGAEVAEALVIIHKALSIGSTVGMLAHSHLGMILQTYKEGLVRTLHRLDDVNAVGICDNSHLEWCSLHAQYSLMVP